MYKIPANTLFIGKNLVFVPECPSTNTLALEISQQSSVKEGTVVITDSQTAGKGQRGNTWEAGPGLNLTFSLILKPGFLAIDKQFYLNIVISLGLKDYLKEKTSATVYIKWPNDILVHGKKISGILIENQLRGSALLSAIAGVGFNLNQEAFGSPSATSLSLLTGAASDKNEELSLILSKIESRYLQLRSSDHAGLMRDYLDAMYLRDERHMFSTGGRDFEGVIRDVDEWGKLRIEHDDGISVFGIKEIQYL